MVWKPVQVTLLVVFTFIRLTIRPSLSVPPTPKEYVPIQPLHLVTLSLVTSRWDGVGEGRLIPVKTVDRRSLLEVPFTHLILLSL